MANNHTFYNLFFFLSRLNACFSMLFDHIHTLQGFFFFGKKKYLEECMRDIFLFEKCMKIVKDGRPYLFHSFRNKYFNKISLGNMLYFQNKL